MTDTDRSGKMREPNSFQKVNPPQRSFSIRLSRSRDEVKQQFVKNRRSGDFGYSLGSDALDISDNADDGLIKCKDDTLDPGPAAVGIQHNLRPLLRNKYRQHPLSDMEDDMESGWGTWSREGGVEIKHFGMIDQPPQEQTRSYQSLQLNKR
jgi:hypothetical protein